MMAASVDVLRTDAVQRDGGRVIAGRPVRIAGRVGNDRNHRQRAELFVDGEQRGDMGDDAAGIGDGQRDVERDRDE